MATVALSACTADGDSPDASAAQSATGPGTSAPPTSSASTPATSIASLEPIPSNELGEFTCELPIVEDPSVTIANITDVRIGTHPDHDRVVFEFEQGTPELTLDRATPPFSEDASGLPVDVDGTSFLRLTMRGGTRQTDDGTSSYDGPTDFDPALPAVVDLLQGGDFERQSTWYLGLTLESCVRVLLLEEPPRLVIDVEHP
jgi:hypothetical protein